MFHLTQFLLLSLPIFGIYINAIPLSNTLQNNGTGTGTGDYESDVIEINPNIFENSNINIPGTPGDIIDLSFYGSALYGTPDTNTTAALVANYTAEEYKVNPEELGSYLEGDILVPINDTNGELLTKNGVVKLSSRWPNGIVPFEIRGNFNAHEMSIIERAIEEYHTRTCIRFVPHTMEKDYISIERADSGCWSSVGRMGGKQEVNLQSPGCLKKVGTTIHELMHALGFLHEQNREERDYYVSIQYQNIKPEAAGNFDKAPNTEAFGVPYDFDSVMHYSRDAFSSNGQPTIMARVPGVDERMGQRNGFSEYDVQKLNKMYGCEISSLQNPAPAPTPVDNNIINSFLSGFMSGLGLGDTKRAVISDIIN